MPDKLQRQDAALGVLGQSVSYADRYDPALLFPVPRSVKRLELGLEISAGQSLPFEGEDLWNAYEISWLNPKGKPQIALGQFRFPADTPFLVESKSLKLYLNSFNQTVLPGRARVEQMLAEDLSAVAGGAVHVVLQAPEQAGVGLMRGRLPGVSLDELDIEVACYDPPRPAFLRSLSATGSRHEILHSSLLKSNCLVTGQPDWASVVIEYEGLPLDREGMLRYLISFRQHNEFHEQCVERIFMDVMNACRPEKLSVWARYTRRGGLDINPWRTSVAGFGVPPAIFDVRQ